MKLALKLMTLYIFWYIVLLNPFKRQLNTFSGLCMSIIDLIWLLSKLRLLYMAILELLETLHTITFTAVLTAMKYYRKPEVHGIISK